MIATNSGTKSTCGVVKVENQVSNPVTIEDRTHTIMDACGGACGDVLTLTNDNYIVISEIYVYESRGLGTCSVWICCT